MTSLSSKRIRLLYKQYCDSSNYLYPSVSFDNGLSWINVDDDIQSLLNGNNKDISINKATVNSTSGLTAVDFSMGFTPFCVPNIVDIKAVASVDDEGKDIVTNFVSNTKYYFAVTSTNFDSTGLGTVEDNSAYELYNCSYEEAIEQINKDSTLTTEQKAAKKKELSEYALKYHIYYDGECKSTDTTDKQLQYYSKVMSIETPSDNNYYNIELYVNYSYYAEGINVYCGTSLNSMNLVYISNLCQTLKTELTNSEIDNTIYLGNMFPLPYKGMVKIDNEYIEYSSCTYDNGWKLKGVRTMDMGLTSHKADTPIYLVGNDNYKTRKPIKVYDYSNLDDSILYYLNFNSENSFEVVNKAFADVLGNPTYSVFDTLYGISYYVDGSSLLEVKYTDADKALVTKGGLMFNFVLTDFDSNSTDNPYIIYPIENYGLYFKINRNNRKLEIGYVIAGDEAVIFSSEDSRIPSLSVSKFNSIGLSWYKNETLNKMIFTLNFDNTTIAMPSEIDSSKFGFYNLFVGGKYSSEGKITDFPIGYVDNVILFNTTINDDFKQIVRKYKNANSTTAGKITLGYLFNSSDMDNINSYNDMGTNKSNHLYDYTFDSSGSQLGNLHYEPKIHTIINRITAVDPIEKTDKTDVEEDNLYDNWLMYEYVKQDADGYSVFPSIAYPINPSTVQVKYKMGYTDSGVDNNGFTTPFLYNPSVIVSSVSIG